MRKAAAALMIALACVIVFFALRPPLGPAYSDSDQAGVWNPNPMKANKEQYERIKPYFYVGENY